MISLGLTSVFSFVFRFFTDNAIGLYGSERFSLLEGSVVSSNPEVRVEFLFQKEKSRLKRQGSAT